MAIVSVADPSDPLVNCYAGVAIPTDQATAIGAHVRAQALEHLRPTSPDGYHITLAYYGQIPTSELAELMGALVCVTSETGRFRLMVVGAGRFDDRAEVWAGVNGDTAELTVLRNEVLAATARFGATAKQRAGYLNGPFVPHVTVAHASPDHPEVAAHFARALTEVGHLADLEVSSVDIFVRRGTRHEVFGCAELRR